MTRPRTLTVLVDELLIEDGAIPPPRVGSISSLPLRFVERSSDSERSTTIRARLEPDGLPPRAHGGYLYWSGLLRGDGWTADWVGSRPRTGQVELIGEFDSIYEIGSQPTVRGKITRIRLITRRYRATDHSPPRWEPTADTEITADLDAAPCSFDRRHLWTEPTDRTAGINVPIGVLVDLDLDDVPLLSPRSRVVPADVSAIGDVVWVVDARLPVVVRLDANQTATEHFLSGPTGVHSRRILATPGGCWVVGDDGVYRCTLGEPPILVDDTAVSVAAVVCETLLACTRDSGWWLHNPGVESQPVGAPAGSVGSAIDHEGHFVLTVVTKTRNSNGPREFRVIRVSPTGEVASGPVTVGDRDDHDPLILAGNPLSVLTGSGIATIREDLTLGPPSRLPRMHFGGGRAGRYLWTVAHPTDRTGCPGRWSADDSDPGAQPRQFWVVLLLDPDSHEVVGTAPVFTSAPRVAADREGGIWVVADGLRRLGTAPSEIHDPIDIDALLSPESII